MPWKRKSYLLLRLAHARENLEAVLIQVIFQRLLTQLVFKVTLGAIQKQGPWPYCYHGQHPTCLLAGQRGDRSIVYATEFKTQRGRVEVWLLLTCSNPKAN